MRLPSPTDQILNSLWKLYVTHPDPFLCTLEGLGESTPTCTQYEGVDANPLKFEIETKSDFVFVRGQMNWLKMAENILGVGSRL